MNTTNEKLLDLDSPPTCLHVLGQPLVNALWQEGRALRTKDIATQLLATKYHNHLQAILTSNYSTTEQDHINADAALCDFLLALGYKDIVKTYRDIPKHFA